MNIDLKILCKNMRLLRTMKGISQEELADTIHLARSTYSTYETGMKTPDLQTIDALSYLYDIGFDSLVGYDLSNGLLHRIYFEQNNDELLELLNGYEALSVASKNVVMERMVTLLEREKIFYSDLSRSETVLKNGDAGIPDAGDPSVFTGSGKSGGGPNDANGGNGGVSGDAGNSRSQGGARGDYAMRTGGAPEKKP